MIDDPDGVRAAASILSLPVSSISLGVLGQHGPGQQHGDDAGAEAHLRLAEPRAFGGDGDVAGKRHLEGAGHAEAVDQRDGRFGAVPERHDEVELPFHLAAHVIDGRHVPLGRGLHANRSRRRRRAPPRAPGRRGRDRPRPARATLPAFVHGLVVKAFSTCGRLKTSEATGPSISTLMWLRSRVDLHAHDSRCCKCASVRWRASVAAVSLWGGYPRRLKPCSVPG